MAHVTKSNHIKSNPIPLQADIDDLMRQQAIERQALGKVEQLPEKAKWQAESTANILRSLQVGILCVTMIEHITKQIVLASNALKMSCF